MTPRSIRRAAERKALKLARKAERLESTAPHHAAEPESTDQTPGLDIPEADCESNPTPALPLSAARLAANRRNALLSEGPATPAGKKISSMNALKTGLTGKTVLLPTDDAAHYRNHVQAFEQEWQPVGPQEQQLVQSLADVYWRLARVANLEFAIYARGEMQFGALFEGQDQSVRAGLIQLETYLAFEKQIRNLNVQESRLIRRREAETAQLRALQSARKREDLKKAELLARAKASALPAAAQLSGPASGFEYSTAAGRTDFGFPFVGSETEAPSRTLAFDARTA